MLNNWDFIIIGAGIAGTSVAWELAAEGSVLLLEGERQPGYHTTGRSAALYAPSYGNAVVRALTRASYGFYDHPPANFSELPLWHNRDVFFVATAQQKTNAKDFFAQVSRDDPNIEWVDEASFCSRVFLARKGVVELAIHDSSTMELDVAAIHQGYLQGMRHGGGSLRTSARVDAITHHSGLWQVQTQAGIHKAPVLVNAAGAWADVLARIAGVKPLDLIPLRRTIVLVDAPPGVDIADWPMVVDVDEHFYFKPDSGRILASPADETPSPPCDAQPEELDIAIAVDRLTRILDLEVRSIRSKWAGLRTFAPDRTPVIGFDPVHKGFFWLAGQGGFGIQTAPAIARLACKLATGQPIPEDLQTGGVSEQVLEPGRNFLLPDD